MTRLSFSSFTLLSAILLLSACQKDSSTAPAEPETPQQKVYTNVDTRLWSYFDRFEEEARSRGVAVDLASRGITGGISDLEGEHVAGQCNYNFRTPNHITVDQEFWDRSSDRFKEFIIFHELGHCYLFRDHREDSHANGRCVSLMRSGLGNCWDAYNNLNREAYIDELFRPEDF
ncbi:MAG: hypothetical protein AAF990_27675 [Bacteroidota bacterium]